MAAALFVARMKDLADPVEVSSAGIPSSGTLLTSEVPAEVREVMALYGIQLEGHQSRSITEPMLKEVDLVIGMGRRHVQ